VHPQLPFPRTNGFLRKSSVCGQWDSHIVAPPFQRNTGAIEVGLLGNSGKTAH
jgi:hypothetical protein